MIGEGHQSFYQEEAGEALYYEDGGYRRLEENPKILHLAQIKKQKGIIKKNNGASLIDIGDGVARMTKSLNWISLFGPFKKR